MIVIPDSQSLALAATEDDNAVASTIVSAITVATVVDAALIQSVRPWSSRP